VPRVTDCATRARKKKKSKGALGGTIPSIWFCKTIRIKEEEGKLSRDGETGNPVRNLPNKKELKTSLGNGVPLARKAFLLEDQSSKEKEGRQRL